MAAATGLAKGLGVTLRTMFRRSVTKQYPDVKPALPPRSRGVIGLLEENCTVCMLCSRECPDWCIYIDSHKETVPPKEPGARARTRNVLDRFAIDFALCMYCGICIEVCPFDALFWSPEFEYSEYDVRNLTHEKDRLREWMYTVPAPPPLAPEGEVPKEVEAAAKAEPRLAEAPPLGPVVTGGGTGGAVAPTPAAPAAAPAAAAAAAPAAPPETPTPAAGGRPAREHAEIAREDVGIDQGVFDAAIASGLPERVARARAKSAWMKTWKKANAATPDDAPAVDSAAPAHEQGGPAAAAEPEVAETEPASEGAAVVADTPNQVDSDTLEAHEPAVSPAERADLDAPRTGDEGS